MELEEPTIQPAILIKKLKTLKTWTGGSWLSVIWKLLLIFWFLVFLIVSVTLTNPVVTSTLSGLAITKCSFYGNHQHRNPCVWVVTDVSVLKNLCEFDSLETLEHAIKIYDTPNPRRLPPGQSAAARLNLSCIYTLTYSSYFCIVLYRSITNKFGWCFHSPIEVDKWTAPCPSSRSRAFLVVSATLDCCSLRPTLKQGSCAPESWSRPASGSLRGGQPVKERRLYLVGHGGRQSVGGYTC